MSRFSSPLMFLGAVGALWIGGRVVVAMWDGAAPRSAVVAVDGRLPERSVAMPSPTAVAPPAPFGALPLPYRNAGGPQTMPVGRTRLLSAFASRNAGGAFAVPSEQSAPLAGVPAQHAEQAAERGPSDPPPPTQPSPPPRPDRWTLSGWAFYRPDGASPTLGQGQLGGSQAGVRVARRLDAAGRVELYGRVVTSGRQGDGVEGAAGVSVQPLRALPVRFSVERREQLAGSGGRSAFAAFASGGVYELRLPLRFRLDGYAAAGVVGARRRDLFAEGSATVRRQLVSLGPVDIDAGGGVWAAAQPGLERVDVGPSFSARWRAGAVQPRLSVDWRQRVTGDAAPQSGVAVTLATDF